MKSKRNLQAKLRVDASYDLKQALETAIKNTDPIYKSCLNCINFNEVKEECGLFPHTRPPARVIAFGCPKWEDTDEIPF